MSLFDEIQSRLKSSAPAAPSGSAQEAAIEAFKAKTGKANVGGVAPAASNIGEQVAQGAVSADQAQQRAKIATAADQLAQQRQAAQQQAAQQQADLAAQAQTFQIGQQAQAANASGARTSAASQFATQQSSKEALTTDKLSNSFKQATAQLASDKKVTTDDLFETFRQGNQDLAFRKDALALELTAQKLALADKQYVDQLKQTGMLNRLGDDLQFKQEAQRLAMGANWGQLTAQTNFNIDLNSDQRIFDQQIAGMDANVAMSILTKDMGAKDQQMILAGGTKAGVAGLDYWAKSSANSPKTLTTKDNPTTNVDTGGAAAGAEVANIG